jgi:glycosyltransferase involved in cell wall biosynthesis
MLKLLHIMTSVDPKGGGPREGVYQRGVFLEKMGHSVSIVTLDDPREEFLRDLPLTVHALGPSHGSYRYNARLVPWLRAHAHEYDSVIVNGIWQYPSFAAWRVLHKAGIPYFVFVHGMLDPWFKEEYPLKHLKKWLYWPWAEYRVLRDARAVLFTSEEERRLARRSFWLYRANELVVPYGTSSPPPDRERCREKFLATYPELRGRRILLFFGRIHEKKGCDMLVEAFAKLAAGDPALHLVIAGPGRPPLVDSLKDLARTHGAADRISWPGMLQGDLKWGAFYCAEVFVLPSHQENFGIAVAEALGCGLPVLISDKVNIWREVESDKAGLTDSDTLAGTESLLRRWLAMSQDSKLEMSAGATRSFEKRFKVDAMAHGLLDVIAGTKPAGIA